MKSKKCVNSRKVSEIVTINGDEFLKLFENGKEVLLPCDPETFYGRTGEWRGWCSFLGNDNIDEVCDGITPEEKAREIEWVLKNERVEK